IFFFFQAEDGIRDFHVTGVQTCALPILSMCVDKCSTNSLLFPVRMLTTPLGTSEVFNTSAKVMAQSGMFSEASTTAVFPPAITGIMVDIKPNKPDFSGARIETTPVGSGAVKLKCAVETGLTALKIGVNLSHQPA